MGTMKVILREDVQNLGEEGDVKIVKHGYARNFLIPRGLVITYSKHNVHVLDQQQQQIERRRLQKKENAEELKAKLEEQKVTVTVSAGEKGRLYGTVTNSSITEELNKLDFSIDRRDVELTEHIKFGGVYKYRVHIYHDIYAEMEIEVIAKEEEKKTRTKQGKRRRRDEEFEEQAITEDTVVDDVTTETEVKVDETVTEESVVEETSEVVEEPVVEETSEVVEEPVVEEISEVKANDNKESVVEETPEVAEDKTKKE